MTETLAPGLERRLKAEMKGDVWFDRFTRGRYATDASHYQIMPVGVVAPRTAAEAARAIALARDEGVAVTARGGGTSQAGQTVNATLIIDCSKYLHNVHMVSVDERRCVVDPGITLDELNRRLRRLGLWFPVDISTASRATIGGMVGNNSCGARSLRYGNTRENVLTIDALLADGHLAHFGPIAPDLSDVPESSPLRRLALYLLELGKREASAINDNFPRVQRRVGGYNLDSFLPGRNQVNLAHILVGSEGTLGFSTKIELKLSPLLGRRAVGAVHFGSFHKAMESAQHIVKLAPIAVELIDRTMLGLARDIAMFQSTIDAVVHGDPEAVLFVEFGEEDQGENFRRLLRLSELIGDLGLGWDKRGAQWGGVIEVLDPNLQTAIADLRAAGLNVMMSMKSEGKPVSFVEDCAVPLEHLADYTARLTEIFEKHGTRGTWYAHASVGCLHVRPVLNLRLEKDVHAMRAIAEEAFAMVREYKGSHSGEHGDGIVRSEFHQMMFGGRLVRAFEEVKDRFDPKGLFNPGKIVRAPKFDNRSLFRYPPDYRAEEITTRLDWSAYTGAGGGFQGAVEMCNNNGACRAMHGGVMCPSYRVTRDEKDVTRGRANTLRLALTGQLGPDALTSDEMANTLKLCVSCKACRRECPTGVDMARMKIEVSAARAARRGLSLHNKLVGYLPRYAPWAARLAFLSNAHNDSPRIAQLIERFAGFSSKRSLPRWRRDFFRNRSLSFPSPERGGSVRATRSGGVDGGNGQDAVTPSRRPSAADLSRSGGGEEGGHEVVLFADTFNRYFEPENLEAAMAVLTAAGCRVHLPQPVDGSRRPLCCGRTFLSVGLIDEARREAARCVATLAPFATRGIPIVGLEPSCLLGFRDEIPALLKTDEARWLASRALLFEEFIVGDISHDALKLAPVGKRALVHGHCHQKSFGVMDAVTAALGLVPDLTVATIESGCCGMAGAFGYGADTVDMSMQMGELALFPSVREAQPDTLIVADGTSCRHQIKDGAARQALHVARVLAMSLETTGPTS